MAALVDNKPRRTGVQCPDCGAEAIQVKGWKTTAQFQCSGKLPKALQHPWRKRCGHIWFGAPAFPTDVVS
jgi:hypothetical protein